MQASSGQPAFIKVADVIPPISLACLCDTMNTKKIVYMDGSSLIHLCYDLSPVTYSWRQVESNSLPA